MTRRLRVVFGVLIVNRENLFGGLHGFLMAADAFQEQGFLIKQFHVIGVRGEPAYDGGKSLILLVIGHVKRAQIIKYLRARLSFKKSRFKQPDCFIDPVGFQIDIADMRHGIIVES